MKIQQLKVLIGKWKTSGVVEKTPFGPAGLLRGHDSYEWSDHKDFVIHNVEVSMGRKRVRNSEVISFDPAKKAFAMFAFEAGSVVGLQHGKFSGRKWSIDGEGIRFRGEFDASHTTLVGEWQYRDAKKKWQRYMTLELRK